MGQLKTRILFQFCLNYYEFAVYDVASHRETKLLHTAGLWNELQKRSQFYWRAAFLSLYLRMSLLSLLSWCEEPSQQQSVDIVRFFRLNMLTRKICASAVIAVVSVYLLYLFIFHLWGWSPSLQLERHGVVVSDAMHSYNCARIQLVNAVSAQETPSCKHQKPVQNLLVRPIPKFGRQRNAMLTIPKDPPINLALIFVHVICHFESLVFSVSIV